MGLSSSKRIVFLAAALASSAGCVAQSQQMPNTHAHPVQNSWSGFYAGLQFGGDFTNGSFTAQKSVTAPATASESEMGRNGFIGGGQLGYGRQLDRLYLGAEIDAAFGRFLERRDTSTPASAQEVTFLFNAHRRYVGTVRGRVGYPVGRFLFFGTAGFANGMSEQAVTATGPGASNADLTSTRRAAETGYTLGAGAEFRGSRRLSYKLQYLHYRLYDGTLSVPLTGVPLNGTDGQRFRLQDGGSLLGVGANFRF